MQKLLVLEDQLVEEERFRFDDSCETRSRKRKRKEEKKKEEEVDTLNHATAYLRQEGRFAVALGMGSSCAG